MSAHEGNPYFNAPPKTKQNKTPYEKVAEGDEGDKCFIV